MEQTQDKDLRKENDTVFLCCGRKNCPSVKRLGTDIVIEDDFNGLVRMTEEQAKLLGRAVNEVLILD